MPTLPKVQGRTTEIREAITTQKTGEKGQPSPSQKSTIDNDRLTASSAEAPLEQHHDNDLQEQAKGDSDHTDGVNLQPHEDRKGGDGIDGGMITGIPWALPKEPDHVLQPAVPESSGTRLCYGNDSDNDGYQENDQEKEDGTDTDRNTPSTPMSTGVDRPKTYRDKRKAGITGSGGRANGGGTRNGKSSSRVRNSWGKTGKGNGDGGHAVGDGYYGPQESAPPSLPCTMFTPTTGKVRRLRDSAALVVGLDAGEQLCFVGATRMRCGCGRADIAGFTLLPVPWGPYLEVHSPRWMSLQVIRALDSEERLDTQPFSSATGDGRVGQVAAAARWDSEGEEANLEGNVEEAIDELAENFAVVIAFRPLEDNPLNFLSAQGDADSLNALNVAINTPRSSAETSALELAAELRLPGMQIVVKPTAGLHPLSVPQEWADAMDAVIRAPSAAPPEGNISVLVCGAKGVGKSTVCRLLVNRMLGRHTQVAFLDCDLGQPEFTPPGLVSLHKLDTPVLGPPHTNIRRPELAYFIGTTTSKPEPLLYSAAVRSLAEQAAAPVKEDSTFLADSTPPAPLVVNTDGWVKGMGEDLLGAVIDAVRPQHIVQLLGASSAKQFDLDRLPEGCQVHRICEYSAPVEPLGGLSAPALPCTQDLRTLRLVSYFVGCGTEGHEGREARGSKNLAGVVQEGISRAGGGSSSCVSANAFWPGGATLRGGALYDQQHEVAALLSRRKPRRVPWIAVRIRVMNGPVPPNLMLHAINGALVGLVADPDPRNVGAEAAGKGYDTTGGGLVCLEETPLRPCVGLGLVRSVDVEQRVLYILTPEPLEVLKEVNVLVKGSLQLPMDMLYDPNWCSHPYFSAEAVGGEVIKSRNYLLRR